MKRALQFWQATRNNVVLAPVEQPGRIRHLTWASGLALASLPALLLLSAATPAMAQAPSITINISSVASTGTTAIPAGSGAFSTFCPTDPFAPPDPCIPADPMISNGNVVFWGGGSGGQQGIYSLLYGTLTKASDLNTAIPGGSGDFINFWPQDPLIPTDPFSPPDPMISGANISFAGNGNGQAGVYVSWPPTPVHPLKVVDLNTVVPGSTTATFTAFPTDPYISGLNVAFIGLSDGNQGVYFSSPTIPALPGDPIYPNDPIKIADLNTPIPGGTGNFTGFGMGRATPVDPCLSGNNLAFVGFGAATASAPLGQTGIYVVIPQDPVRAGFPSDPVKLADASTLIPGSTVSGSTFTNFWQIATPNDPIFPTDPITAAFVGGVVTFVGNPDTGFFEVTQQGVYTVSWQPQDPIQPGDPMKIADLHTTVPGTTVTFSAFGSAAIDPAYVVFDAWYSPDGVTSVHGLFTNLTGTLTKLLDNTQSVGGKQLSDFSFGPGGFSGNQVVFNAQYADGSQGIANATVSGNKCPASQGYWKNNPSAWPVKALFLGNQSYAQTQLLNILGTSTTSDASLVLARQLIAAKLNVLRFGPNVVGSTISDSDRLLTPYGGKLPYNVGTNSTAGKPMLKDSGTLQNYNNDSLTPGCTQ